MVSQIKEVGSPKSKEFLDEGSQTLSQPAMSTSDPRKRPREPTFSPVESGSKKPEEKRLKASKKEEERVKVSVRKNPHKTKPKKKAAKALERSRCARSEVVLIKPSAGMSYASILRDLMKRVNPDELGATVQEIR